MDFLNSLKDVNIWSNTVYDYIMAFVIFVGLLLFLKLFQYIIIARLQKLAKKTKTDFDDVLVHVFKNIKPPFYFFIAVYFGLKVLALPDLANKVLYVLFLLFIIFEVVRALEKIIDYFVSGYLSKTKKEHPESAPASRAMMKTMQTIIRIGLWIIGLLLLLSNLGVNVNTFIASLGIGGIAVALALQNVLGDIFAAFSIYMDKPFQVGDCIAIGNDGGTVEKIGLKTTRIRTLLGEELVIPNQELISSRVQNFRKMERRRIVFNLGVIYNTQAKQLEEIPKMIKKIIEKEKMSDFDRCYFTEFGDYSLKFEVVMYINSADYEDYLKTRHNINLEIYRQFAEAGIDFAYPTQTILVNKD